MGDALALRSDMGPYVSLLTGNLGLKYSSPSRSASSQINREQSLKVPIRDRPVSFNLPRSPCQRSLHTSPNCCLRSGCCIHQCLFQFGLWDLLFLFRGFSSCLSFAVRVQSWTVGSRVHIHYCSCCYRYEYIQCLHVLHRRTQNKGKWTPPARAMANSCPLLIFSPTNRFIPFRYIPTMSR